MTRPPSIPADLCDAIPPSLRPAIAAVVSGLEARIADLEARLNQTSANSSRPPSTDPPHTKPAPAPDRPAPGRPARAPEGRPRPPPGRRRRAAQADPVPPLLPPPDRGRPDPARPPGSRAAGGPPARHGVPPPPTRLPGVRGRHLRPLPADAAGGYGPRAEAACALLAGGHRLGKRAAFDDLGGAAGHGRNDTVASPAVGRAAESRVRRGRRAGGRRA